ncbi:hypothetical protein [Corynebacterium sp. AOP12-C2-36]|uniref:hypothetical protein n=1 Tax=Corynebacterium sp. AOP12-C2-36 TaxID=3457723 RepID=UPI004033F5E9
MTATAPNMDSLGALRSRSACASPLIGQNSRARQHAAQHTKSVVDLRFLLTSRTAAGTTVAVVDADPTPRVFVSSGPAARELVEVAVTDWLSFGADGTVMAVSAAGDLYVPQPDQGLGAGSFADEQMDLLDPAGVRAQVRGGRLTLSTAGDSTARR